MMIYFSDWCALARLIRGGRPAETLAAVASLTLLSLLLLPASAVAEDDKPVVEADLYGFARLDAVLLTHRMNHPQYSMWVQPDDIESSGTPNLTVYGRLTRIGISVDADRLSDTVDLEGKVEADFQNGGSESRPAPRLRHGYGKVSTDDLFALGGQTWDLVSPLYTSAHADALMWNAGNLGDRRPQLRLGWTPGDDELGGRVAAAAATTGAVDGKDLDGNGRLDGFESGVPMLQGLAELTLSNWVDTPLTAGVSGSWALERLSDPEADGTPEGDDASFQSYSVNAHVSVPLTSWWTLRGEGFFGANLSDIRGGIGQGIETTTGDEIRSLGGWGEMAFTPLDIYSITVGGSIDSPFEEDLASGDGVGPRRDRNLAAYLVQKVRPWKPVQIGLEYWYWNTRYVDRPTGTAHRVNLHTSVFF